MSPAPQQIIDAALSSLLTGRRHRIKEAEDQVPDAAGLYAVYGSQGVWRQLQLGSADSDLPLYVGKAERSLVSRDIKTHFASGRTGSSTLRRSFAALLREEHGLRGVPRNVNNPERPANYGLSPEHDNALTTWMLNHLQLAVWSKPANVDLDAVETSVLGVLQPPMNLSKVSAPSPVLRTARRVMADDVRTWARERGLEL
ncbi:GIY-YIG nuclease family protein [Nocardioides bizhenqiangii]|uniref:GIY-YIG catalytic domain-containing protein n=1 Tax=Nocardioides bizhenqiangii TaxID=3095076 RepID=A0ABZ0ZWJ9_9ACTN|nr:hypothetical protein [Nocardioides sp. HM61]WQQ27653.1 hypothetical protein SHK19_05310 [Nocardioides sp. HM61]